jgi:putative intracellular protease/amidase
MNLHSLLALGAGVVSNVTGAKRPDAGVGPVLIVLTSHDQLGDTGKSTGFHLAELTHPLSVFEAAGLDIELASIQGGEPPADAVDLDDPINATYWNDEGFRKTLRNTAKLEDLDGRGYSIVLFPGGHGTMWDLPENAAVQRIVREAWESGAIIAAVCHGPAALVNVKLSNGQYLVKGREIATFTDEEEREVKLDNVVPFLLASKLKERGALHRPADNFKRKVVVSERLVTGQNPASALALGERALEVLRAQYTKMAS